uniref:cartilage-associated protein-like n=1 Tax=Styela clava TaxID=7725 RepID=UPI00193A867E|nr:cartilage-associated protein-like [Styela clava]
MQLFVIFSLLLVCFIIQRTSSQTTPGISIQNVIARAVDDYKDENYEDCIKGFEAGLVHWRMLKHIDTTCGLRCKNLNISKEIGINMDGFDELIAYGNILAQANCIKLCKEEHPFTKSKIQRPSDDFVADFDTREPYNYLQFAYYKTGMIRKACQAAHTNYQVNSDDKQMRDNIAYYKGLDGVSDDYFKDLEGNPYNEHIVDAVDFYENKQYEEAIDSFEKALLDYLKVHDECETLCYNSELPTFFYRFPQSVVLKYIPVIECVENCGKKLRPLVRGDLMDNLVQKVYQYLQFSYYQLGKWGMAVPAAVSALLLHPEDEITQNNVRFYRDNAEEHGLKLDIHFLPRPEAVKYNFERMTNEKLVEMMQKAVDVDDQGEVEESEIQTDEEFGDEMMKEITKQVTLQLGNKLRGDIG